MSSTDHSLRQRYGAPSRARRLLLIGIVAVVVVAFGGWLGWATLTNATPPVDSKLIGFEIVDDHTATAVVRVEMSDDAEDVRCRVRAIATDKVVVGEVAWSPAPAEGPDHRIEIATDRRATAVEAIGCTADGQPRPR